MEATIVESGQGHRIARPTTHGAVTVKVATKQVTIFDTERPAGDAGGPALHAHPGFEETFYVVEGEWEFVLGDRTVLAGPGAVVHIPRGTFHTHRSTGGSDSKLVGVAVPGGIEDFFEEAARTGDDDEAGRRHGIRFER